MSLRKMNALSEETVIPKHNLAVYQEESKANLELWSAAKKGKDLEVERWLKAGGCPNYYNEKDGGLTAVHAATEAGDIRALQSLLDRESSDEAMIAKIQLVTTVTKSTALHIAAAQGHIDCLDLLLNKGADLEAKNAYGNTALMLACGGNQFQCVKTLIAHGAKVSAKSNKKRETALHMAIAGILYTVRTSGITSNPQDMVRVVDLLLEEGVNADAADDDGTTPLHLAVLVRNDDTMLLLVESLLAKGANIHSKDINAKRPIDLLQVRASSTIPTAVLKLLTPPSSSAQENKDDDGEHKAGGRL